MKIMHKFFGVIDDEFKCLVFDKITSVEILLMDNKYFSGLFSDD